MTCIGMGKKSKKVNPRKHLFHMNEQEFKRELERAANNGVGLALALFITVMVDKYGFSQDDVQELWKHLNKLSEEVKEGRVSAWDLRTVLEEEYNVILS